MITGSFNRFMQRNAVLLGLSILLLPSISMAQQYYDPGLLQKSIDRKPLDYQPPGLRLGGFVLGTGAELAYESNDNVYYIGDDGVSDSIFHLRPWANLNSDWNRHALNLNFFADIGRYDDFGDEDYEDWVADINGRVDVKRGSHFSYTASYSQLHEDRSSPDDVSGIKPTDFAFSGIDLGYSHTFNRLTGSVDYNMQETDYDNNLDGEGNVIDNQGRDRSRDSFQLRLNYDYLEQSAVFLGYGISQTDYDQQFDKDGYERSSSGSSAKAGFAWDMTGILTGDLFLQYIEQDYDDPRLESVDGFGIGAGLLWTPTELTNINVRFVNSVQETTQAFTSGYYSSLYSVRIQHELRRNWLLNARVSYTDNEYEYSGEEAGALTGTEVVRAGAGVSYLINRYLYVSGGYVFEKQSANSSSFEYETNRWFVTFGAEL